jgi:hypothetical protein
MRFCSFCFTYRNGKNDTNRRNDTGRVCDYGASALTDHALNDKLLDMKKWIIFISAFFLAAMMLASCDSIPSAFNPFSSETTTSTSEEPETSQTNHATYEMPLGRNPENHVSTDY